MDRIRVAFIGNTGHFKIYSCLGSDGVELVAAAPDGYNPEVSRAAEQLSAPVFDDYRRMLDETRPDVASLGCWYAHNGEAAIECLRRGIHVLTDKPAVNSWAELAEAASLAKKGNLHFLTEFEFRSDILYGAAAGAVRDGLIGQPVLVRGQKSYQFRDSRPDFYRYREHYAGTAMWIASHMIDMVSWATGLDYLSFSGLQGNISRPEYGQMEDHVALLARLEKGAAAMITADFLRPSGAPDHADDRLRIAGSRGVVEVIGNECRLVTATEAPKVLAVRAEHDKTATGLKFIETLRGRGDGTFSTAETLRMARCLLAARDALDTEREVLLRDLPGAG